MKTTNDIATFYFIQLVNGTFSKSIESGIIVDKFKGGIQVQSNKFPNGKCICNENIISFS